MGNRNLPTHINITCDYAHSKAQTDLIHKRADVDRVKGNADVRNDRQMDKRVAWLHVAYIYTKNNRTH